MKYLTKQTADSFLVRLSGPEEEQKETSILAENIFNTPVKDTYAGRVIEFASKKQFKNFLFWRGIFNRHDLNKRFNFMKLARPAAKDARGILGSLVAELESLDSQTGV